jgi:hypothetical protein
LAKLNDQGLETEYTYFDANDKPVKHNCGYSRMVNIYDDQGTIIDAQYFDVGPVTVKPLVTSVWPNELGAKLGLKEGDVFLRYDGREIANSFRLIAVRKLEKTDDPPRELVVRRGKGVLRFQVKPGLMGAVLDDKVVPRMTDRETELTKDVKQDGEKVPVQ